MISKTSRFVFVCEFALKTVYSRFTPPAALTVLKQVSNFKNRNILPIYELGQRKVSLTEIRFVGAVAHLLFRLTDPDIPDNILENEGNGDLREATRNDGEVPARSAHLVIDCSAAYDASAAYPATIENVDYLTKGLMTLLLNKILKNHFTEQRNRDDQSKTLEYSPRMEFRGHQSQTIANVLQGGGTLEGLKFVTNKVVEDAFGDSAYSVITSTEVTLDVRGAPSGDGAISWVRDKYEAYMGPNLKKAKIVICDTSGRTKTSELDAHIADVTNNFFILQRLINDFEYPLLACEERIRDDVAIKMTAELPTS